MIFVSVGTQKFQMNRLMKQIEKLASENQQEKFVVQYGNSTYVPKGCEVHQFMDRDTFSKCMDESDMLILHGGVGTIMQGLHMGKPIVVVPRLKKYGEHVDDHQLEAAWALKDKHCLLICVNTKYLGYLVKHAREYDFSPYEEPKHKVEDLVLEALSEKKVKVKHTWSLKRRIMNFFALGPSTLSKEDLASHVGYKNS